MARQFLAGVARVDMMVGNEIIATANTLLDSSINIGSSSEDVRGGDGAKLVGKYFHTSTFDINLTDVLFKLEYLAFQTGSTIEQIADIFTQEQVTITGNKGTISGSVAEYREYGKIAWVLKPESDSYETVEVGDDNSFTYTADDNSKVCVKYLSSDDASRKITISSNFIPDEVQLVMTANLFKAGKNNDVNQSSKIGQIQVVVPRFIFNGSQEISMTSTGVANSPISGSAMDNESSDCNGGGYYAIITETIFGKKWYDDVFALAIEDSEMTVKSGESPIISVYALKNIGAPFKPNASALTFTTDVDTFISVDANGKITYKGAGTTVVTVVATDKTELSAIAEITTEA